MSYQTTKFAKYFSGFLGGGECFPFWKGRVALYAILRGLGIGDGDEVILPGYTCVMDVNPIMYCGARPIYVDIDPATYNLTSAGIETSITSKTRAIIAQHTFGIPCDMDSILAIGHRHGIPVIEDCCMALGATYKGRLCGTMGVAAYWSFQWNKTVTTGLGGMAVVHDQQLATKIRKVCSDLQQPKAKSAMLLGIQRLTHRCLIYPRTTAFATALFRWLTAKGIVIGSSSVQEFIPIQGPDFFMGMSDGQARAGLKKFGEVDQNFMHRRKIVKIYEDELHESASFLPRIPYESSPVYVRYPVRVIDKDFVLKEAVSRCMEMGTWFESPLHPKETPLEKYDYTLGQCPQAESAVKDVVNLPTHPRVSPTEAIRSVKFIKSYLRN